MRVFITGASSGIGRALAERYAAQGATVGLVARRAALLETVRAALPTTAGQLHRAYALDVTERGALSQAALDFMAGGVPEVVIANAGVSYGGLTEHAEDLEGLRTIFSTNVFATADTFQPFITPMRALARARLVGIASVAGIRGLPQAGAYCASKAAVISYCESLRVELRDTPIRVVTLVPGFVRTPMTEGNRYPMPFLMPVERFAAKAARAIDLGHSYRVIPWQMAGVAHLLRALPNVLFDAAFSRAPRKARHAD